MRGKVLADAIKQAAAPERARRGFEQLGAAAGTSALPANSPEQARLLAALFSGSQAMGNLLLGRHDWLPELEPERLRFPRREQGLRHEVADWLKPLLAARDYNTALGRVREFKQREMLRIAVRDLARLGNIVEITREISDVADVCLDAVWQVCSGQLMERHGRPWHQDAAGKWQRTGFCVLGMGKLGGQELNYSSDVDVLFVYSEEGQVFREAPARNRTPRPVMPSHQFFKRLAEAIIAEVSRMAPEGTLFRIDLRLRPEGDAGPLCRSLGSYENYYAQWGQTWERMMLIKTRRVAGDEGLAAEFLEMIQPFRFPRAVNQSFLQEIGVMKDRIENEVLRPDELERNVKLGRGGIREIEFIVQSQQLLHAGRQPFLQTAQTLPCLDKLAQYHLLADEDARALRDAYGFLRDVEHRLQMEENLQTHTIPDEPAVQERLAKLMGFASAGEFAAAQRRHADTVRGIFDRVLKSEQDSAPGTPFPREFSGAEAEWKTILAAHAFRDPDKACHVLREFVEGPGYVHISPRTTDLAHKLLPRLFALCPKRAPGGPTLETALLPPAPCGAKEQRDGRKSGTAMNAPLAAAAQDQSATGNRQSTILSDPDRVITRLDSFISAYGARTVLFDLWNSNPAIFELLLKLFDRSEFLAELAIRTPDLVDELVTSGRLRQRKSAAETLRDLRHGLRDADQHLWLRRYHQAELMRIGLRDILGLADPEQYLTELSALADACLQYAVEVVMRKRQLKSPPFTVIGLGKLGGEEIDYGSDLDLLFIADAKAKSLVKLQQAALEVMDLLSKRTELGILFHTDARLRPDGEKGLLVNTLAAYEEYYRERAQLWEIQSLTRTRPVAGDAKLGGEFQRVAARLANFSQPDLPLAAYSSDWRDKIHNMRMRIEKERTPPGKDDLAIKTGKGGLMDAEFVAQAFCLENGWQEANTVLALERGRAASASSSAESSTARGRKAREGELAAADWDRLIANYRQLRKVEGILRRWSYEGETVLPDDPAPYYRVSVRCGFATPEAFRQAMADCRGAIREVYLKIFEPRRG